MVRIKSEFDAIFLAVEGDQNMSPQMCHFGLSYIELKEIKKQQIQKELSLSTFLKVEHKYFPLFSHTKRTALPTEERLLALRWVYASNPFLLSASCKYSSLIYLREG
jgi:hypothetical protein